jgi:hypothetical protein
LKLDKPSSSFVVDDR